MSDPSQRATLFDDAELFTALRRDVVPLLRTWPFVRVWQLGLDVAEDPWALAIMLREEGLFERSTIYATDPDPERVRVSRSGEFERELSFLDPLYATAGGRATLREYFATEGQRIRVRDLLRQRIVFDEHDPRREASFNEFQLILCRPGPLRDDDARFASVLGQSLCRFGVVGFVNREPPRALSRVTGYEHLGPRLLRRAR
jgi:chemotaxis protein methyltransferase CheR